MRATTVDSPSVVSINVTLASLGLRQVSQEEWSVTERLGRADRIQQAVRDAAARKAEARETVLVWLTWLSNSVGAGAASPASSVQPREEPSRPAPARPPAENPPAASQSQRGEVVDTVTGEVIRRGPGGGVSQIKVYAGKGAMQFEVTEPRDTRKMPLTLRVEACKGVNKQYAWNAKLLMNLSLEELQQLVALVHGFIPHVRFANHGAESDRTLEITAQGNQLFARMSTKEQGSLIAVPIPAPWVGSIGLLALKVLKASFPGLSANELLVSLRATVGRLMSDAGRQGGG